MTQMEMNKIILIGGDHYNGLSLVRLFGKRGLHPYGIIVGPTAESGFLRKSRYWEKVWTVSDDSQILDILERQFGKERLKPVIIPWSDGAASTIDKSLDRLVEKFHIPSIGKTQSRLFDMMDKGKQVAFAHSCGMRMAQSYEIDLDGDYSISDIVMPCIGKPIVSCEGDKKDIKRIESHSDLDLYLKELKAKGYHRILIQEYVDIDKEYDIEGFIHENKYTYFVSEKVRTWPDIGGPTAYSFSVNNKALNTEIEKIVHYLNEIEYSGLFDIEIFRSGGHYLFNEINWRNSAVCFAAAASGVEYPLYWYYSVTGKDFTMRIPRRYGVYAMVELLDFHHVMNKQISLKEWMRDLKKSKAKAYFDKSDMIPLVKRFFMFVKRRGQNG